MLRRMLTSTSALANLFHDNALDNPRHLAKIKPKQDEVSSLNVENFKGNKKMKRYGNLLEKIYDKENIKLAIQKASKGKRKRLEVIRVLNDIDYYVDVINDILKNKTYNPSDYTKGIVREGSSKKERIIFKPRFFPDQIIHWAIMLQLQPIFEKSIYMYSCGSIPKRGVHYAKRIVEKWIRNDYKNTKYYLKLDISKFYPSIDNSILIEKIKTKIKDNELIDLITLILSKANGLPIGILLSQWLANFFLNDLDHKIKSDFKAVYYVRYMDDMIIFGPNKRALKIIRLKIENKLTIEGLKLKRNYQIYKFDKEPLDFVGFRFYRNHTTLRRAIMLRITRKVKRVFKKNKLNKHDASSILSYLGWIKHSNSYRLYITWINPYINIKQLKGVIRKKDENDQKN